MKTKTTPEQLKTILAALAKIHVRAFQRESCDTKNDAQRNLRGKTYYCEEDTLRFHHSRIVGGHQEHDGLVYVVTTSDALDMHNTRRGFRTVIFDVFGTVINRPKLEEASRTSDQARKVAEAFELDLLDWYRGAIEERIRHQRQDLSESEAALAVIVNGKAEA